MKSNDFDILAALWLRREKKRRAQKIIEGAPPLTYTAKNAGTLKNYRIYGQTVDGESVGDRTTNLFDCVNHIKNAIQGYRLADDGTMDEIGGWNVTDYIPCKGTEFTLNPVGGNLASICFYDENKNFIYGKAYGTGSANKKRAISAVLNVTAYYIRFTYSTYSSDAFDDLTKIMLNFGSSPLPYEPYGYRVPVTVNDVTTNLYLPKPLKMVGDEAEYIDFGEQKQHRVRKNLFDINNLEDGYDISLETGLPTRDSAYSYIRCAITTPINVSAGDYYLTFNKNIADEIGFIVSVFENNTLISRTPGYYSGSRIRIFSGNNIYIGFYNQNVTVAIHPSDISNVMLNSGSTPLPYEPYIENTEVDVTLPTLPTVAGTNTLSVGTQVQPSKVIVKGKIIQE